MLTFFSFLQAVLEKNGGGGPTIHFNQSGGVSTLDESVRLFLGRVLFLSSPVDLACCVAHLQQPKSQGERSNTAG